MSTNQTKGMTKMVTLNKGAVKFKSIKSAAKALAKQTGRPVEREYMKLYMRIRAGMSVSQAFHMPTRQYTIS